MDSIIQIKGSVINRPYRGRSSELVAQRELIIVFLSPIVSRSRSALNSSARPNNDFCASK